VVQTQFRPGYRISVLDLGVLLLGAIGAYFACQVIWWIGFGIAFVVSHFFLFCNVFRISRPPELIWAACFVLLAGSTIVANVPGWTGTIVASLVLTVLLILLEIRKPSYHAVCWRQWNPKLPEWWESHFLKTSATSETTESPL
jgi:hypothetical protein